jgi:polysaccharide export outer membrane protein
MPSLSFLLALSLAPAGAALAQIDRLDGSLANPSQPVFGQPQSAPEAQRISTPAPYGTPWSSEANASPAPAASNGLPAPVVSPAAAAPAEPVVYGSMDSLDDKRKLTIGDHISYRVIEDKNPAVSLVVTDAGDIEVPLLGRVAAAGKTCRQLANEMKPILEKTYFYKATVIVALDAATMKSPGRIYVTGVVLSPGPQDMPPDEVYTLSKAITRAGGVALFGNDHRVKIVRKSTDGSTENLEVDVGEIINKGRIDKDPVLQPGDLIVVPRKLINF